MSGVPELVALVAQLHDEVRRYAEAATTWQARALFLEDRAKALEAPKPHQTHEASNLTAEAPDPTGERATRTPVAGPDAPTPNGTGGASWWRRWLEAIYG